MKILKSPVFIICCLLFVLHQILQKVLHVDLGYVDSYLDSLLAMPIILTLLVAERRVLFRRGENYRLTVLDVVVATFFIAFVSEVIFPALSSRFTADWVDVVCFCLGSLLFMLLINPDPARESS
ncbi:hypothetical protein D770_07025 [Flammeovirgaceae bacterium 311]|nr:hypothetical protein D770_07025 [Flammeovirgaceae bacterium 311]